MPKAKAAARVTSLQMTVITSLGPMADCEEDPTIFQQLNSHGDPIDFERSFTSLG